MAKSRRSLRGKPRPSILAHLTVRHAYLMSCRSTWKLWTFSSKHHLSDTCLQPYKGTPAQIAWFFCSTMTWVSVWLNRGGASVLRQRSSSPHTPRANVWLRTEVTLTRTKTPLYPRHSALTFSAHTLKHTCAGFTRVRAIEFHVLRCLNALADTFPICQHSIWGCIGDAYHPEEGCSSIN